MRGAGAAQRGAPPRPRWRRCRRLTQQRRWCARHARRRERCLGIFDTRPGAVSAYADAAAARAPARRERGRGGHRVGRGGSRPRRRRNGRCERATARSSRDRGPGRGRRASPRVFPPIYARLDRFLCARAPAVRAGRMAVLRAQPPRRRRRAGAPAAAASGTAAVGRARAPGLCDVEYFDGDAEAGVARELLRRRGRRRGRRAPRPSNGRAARRVGRRRSRVLL